MRVTPDQVRAMAAVVDLTIPDDDLPVVVARLASLLSAMDEIEAELGPEMDAVEPVPPVYPVEPF